MPISQVAAETPSRTPAASPSSTACSAAASFPAPCSCWPASPASASPPCCSRSPPRPRRGGTSVLYVSGEESASQVRHARGAHRRPRGRPLHRRRGRPVRGAGPHRGSRPRPARHRLHPDDRQRRYRRHRRRGHPGPGRRRGTGARRQGAATCRRCWSVTSPRTARSPGHARSSTSSMSSCSSRASATRGSASCAPSRTASGRSTRSAASTSATRASSRWPMPAGSSSRGTPPPPQGTCLTVTLEGRRPLISEVQALVTDAAGHAAAGRERPGVGPAVDAARRSRPTGRRPVVLVRRLRLHRRRRHAQGAGRRPGGRCGAGTAALRYAVPPRRRCHRRGRARRRAAAGPQPDQRLGEAARLGFTRAVVPAGPAHGTGPPP